MLFRKIRLAYEIQKLVLDKNTKAIETCIVQHLDNSSRIMAICKTPRDAKIIKKALECAKDNKVL